MKCLKAVIFDWAGTVVDFGSLCPVRAFQAAFSAKGIKVSPDDICRFMGVHKREHVRSVLSLPANLDQWQKAFGGNPSDGDVDILHDLAEVQMLESIERHALPTPHLQIALKAVRKSGLKIGSTTGYISPLMQRLVPAAKKNGFSPDFWVASDQVPQGRPWPWMIFKNMEHLQICPPSSVVKVGDTVADIKEANNAGSWAVGVVESSSLIGLNEAEFNATSPGERTKLTRHAAAKLSEAGAHFVIQNLSELTDILEQIETRSAKGQMPPFFMNRARNEKL